MRKSINEKLQAVKEATSKRKIKALSVKHGVNVRTIKNWIVQAREGGLSGKALKEAEKISSLYKKPAVRKRPLRSIVYKIFKIELPKKNCESKELYRHVFRDKNCGFLFCSYSSRRDPAITAAMCGMLVSQASGAGYSVKEIITDKVPETEKLGEIMKEYGTSVVRESFSDIRKYTVFSQKKNSYLKERAKYESCGDFIFDSVATVCRNNDLTAGNRKKCRDILVKIKNISSFMHSAGIRKELPGFSSDNLLPVLSSKMQTAIEFHKKYDLENADLIYEKMYHILNNSEINNELLIKVMIQRAKVSGLKKSYRDAENYIKQGLNLLKDGAVNNAYYLRYSLYMLMADVSRIQNNRSRTLLYMNRSGEAIEKTNDPQTSAVYHLNYGKVLTGYSMKNKALESYETARVIVEKNSLNDLKPALEESFASAYSISGRYEESKKIFRKMIKSGYYGDSPYFRALLYAKYADLLHLTGVLDQSLKYYDMSLETISGQLEIDMFLNLAIIIESNKAFSLLKMNRYSEANAIFRRNLRKAQDKNFQDLIMANIAYLIICENEGGSPKEAEKHIRDLGLILKNSGNAEMEYKYHLGTGELLMKKREYLKAEENMLKALSISDNPNLPPTAYFNSAIKLAELYALSKERDKLLKITGVIIKRAKKNNFGSYVFEAEIMRKKSEYLIQNKTDKYVRYLKDVKKTEKNGGKKYFIEREISRYSNN